MSTRQRSLTARPDRRRLTLMDLHNRNHPPRTFRRHCQEWKADMTLRHRWFRVLLHLRGMARCPRNIPWHWRHIAHEFYDREPRC